MFGRRILRPNDTEWRRMACTRPASRIHGEQGDRFSVGHRSAVGHVTAHYRCNSQGQDRNDESCYEFSSHTDKAPSWVDFRGPYDRIGREGTEEST